MELELTGVVHKKVLRVAALAPSPISPIGRIAGPRKTSRGLAVTPAPNTEAAVAGQGAANAAAAEHRGHPHPHPPPTHPRRKCVCPPACSDRVQVRFPQVWNELRLNQQLCDGAIRCADGKVLKVHRAILSAVSPYFKALFTNSFSGGQLEASEVRLAEASSDAVRLILDYAYTGQCGVTARNVERLLPLADRLDVVGVVQQCCHFLLGKMQPDNCLGIFRFAQQYFCNDLEASGRRFILHHFRHILHESAELYDLSASELCLFLSDDKLNARSEDLVFEAIRRWVDRDIPARRQHLADLLSCVRFGLTSLQFLESTVLQYGPIGEDQVLLEVLGPAKAFLADAEARGGDVDLRNPLARPRIPHEILFAVGGWSASSPTNSVETYDCRANRWCLSFSTDTQPRAYHGLVELNGLIYMIGGFDGVEHHNTVRSFNPGTREWREQACMYQARCYVSVCTLGGEIYAVGGFDGRSRMKSAETYDPQKNQWRLIPSMNRARSDASAASLNGKVYIAGGFNGQELLNCAEVFDPGTLQWTCITRMQNLRSGVSLLAHRGYLYALGGFNGNGRLKSGERYDPISDIWQPIPDMLYPRSNFAAVILDDHIYVIGGFNGVIIPNTECFDLDTNKWSEANMMNLNRSALSAVVLAGLPTAEEYSYLQTLQQEHCTENQ